MKPFRIALAATLFCFGIALAGAPAFQAAVPAAAQGDCLFTPTVDPTPLYHAPMTDPGQQKGLIPAGTPHPVTSQSGEHFYLYVDDEIQGWVDRRSGMLSGECNGLPVDPRPLTEYPTICTLITAAAQPQYSTADLEGFQGTLPPGIHIVIQQTPSAYLVRLDHAYALWVASSAGTLSGACAELPSAPARTAVALENARAWSLPDVTTGVVVFDLPVGAALVITGGPVAGRIRYDTDDEDDWYRIQWADSGSGWVWQGRLALSPLPPETPPQALIATTGEQARAWSAPDVKTGRITAFLPADMPLTVLEGPVQGPIRYDSDAMGAWYLVRWSYAGIGWMWEGRLTFE
jgi:hypothetical protein